MYLLDWSTLCKIVIHAECVLKVYRNLGSKAMATMMTYCIILGHKHYRRKMKMLQKY